MAILFAFVATGENFFVEFEHLNQLLRLLHANLSLLTISKKQAEGSSVVL